MLSGGVRGAGEVKVVAGYSLACNDPPYIVAGYVPGVKVCHLCLVLGWG